jgi:predicted NAD/FAD-binding protein
VLGGRARVVEKDGQRVDNGQHILLGAYTETLRMLRLVGVKPSVLETRRLALVYPGEACELRAAPLPAPLHLASACCAPAASASPTSSPWRA